jgi:hypothetical protein
MQERTYRLYQDIRFWLALASFCLLLWMTMKGYPV